MNSPIIGLRATSRRLRKCEEAIATQRKLIAAESTDYGRQAERENLTRLLRKLDELLAESGLVKTTRDRRNARPSNERVPALADQRG